MNVAGLPPRMRGIQVKIQRSWDHLLDLEKDVAYLLYHKRYDIVSELSSDETELRGFLKLHAEPPFEKWGVVVGDIVHNLRSALEHLAWQIVDANGGAVGRDIKFPIYKVESDYINWRRPIPERRKRDPFAGVDEAAIKAIEAEQPYAGENGDPATHPLAVLNDLWNRDKHQIVTPALFQYPEVQRPEHWPRGEPAYLISPAIPFGCTDFDSASSGKPPWTSDALIKRGRLDDPQHLVTFFGKPTGPDPQVQMYGNLTPEICLEDGRILTDAIRSLANAVMAACNRLVVWIQ